jgi:hypothetical protein
LSSTPVLGPFLTFHCLLSPNPSRPARRPTASRFARNRASRPDGAHPSTRTSSAACLASANCRPIECHSTKTTRERCAPANPYARLLCSAPTNGATPGCGPSRRDVTSEDGAVTGAATAVRTAPVRDRGHRRRRTAADHRRRAGGSGTTASDPGTVPMRRLCRAVASVHVRDR